MRSIAPVFALLTLLAVIDVQADESSFNQCLRRMRAETAEAGFSSSFLDKVFATATYEPRVIEADRTQPEFNETLKTYLERRVTPERVKRGRAMARRYEQLLARVEKEYGVQPKFLVALWGLETDYGGSLGSTPVLSSLATLTCDGRRGAFFKAELVSALRILGRGDVDLKELTGSWAGAMGHTQFMPSTYLTYGVDGDGDTRIDLRNSIPDAIFSAARLLRSLGWDRGARWGREVSLPDGFPFEHAYSDEPQSLDKWRELGVKSADGSPLPDAPLDATLLVPVGHRGPAFLAYDNFRALSQWNRSESYSLAVALLADRIAGSPEWRRELPADAEPLSRERVRALQRQLAALGFDPGRADGVLGPGTRRAISAFQRSRKLVADGYPDEALLEALAASSGAGT
jgi:membrane-bound lytic murein transglycosylase B